MSRRPAGAQPLPAASASDARSRCAPPHPACAQQQIDPRRQSAPRRGTPIWRVTKPQSRSGSSLASSSCSSCRTLCAPRAHASESASIAKRLSVPALLMQTGTVSAAAVSALGRPERHAPPPPPSQGDRLRTALVHERRSTSAGARARHPTLPYPGGDLDAAGHGVHLGVPLREQLGAADDGGRDARACGASSVRFKACFSQLWLLRPRALCARARRSRPSARLRARAAPGATQRQRAETPEARRCNHYCTLQGLAGPWGGAGRAVHGRVAVHRARDALDLAQHALGRARVGQHEVNRARALRVQPCARAGRVTARAEPPRAASSLPGPAARQPAQPRRPMHGARGCRPGQAHCARWQSAGGNWRLGQG